MSHQHSSIDSGTDSAPSTARNPNASFSGGGVGASGEFQRRPSRFRARIEDRDDAEFPAEADRYHLYVSFACPWAHRTLLTRQLLGLHSAISVDVVDTLLTDKGWTLHGAEQGATGDRVHGLGTLRNVYQVAQPAYEGGVTVPVLYDKERRTIVNNESADIIRMLNSDMRRFAEHPDVELVPAALQGQIDDTNRWVYEHINNGVYRCGFARSQSAYDRAARRLFGALDRAEQILAHSRFLIGNQLTEADIRLFPTLVRFDLVYHTHFKCNVRRLVDYPNLWSYTRDIYALPGVSSTIRIDHIKRHYYRSHESINPFSIVPLGPDIDFGIPSDRAQRFQ